MAQWYRIPLPMQETWVLSLVGEDTLEKKMAIHSSVLTWKIPLYKGAWQTGLQSMGSQRVGYNWAHTQWLIMLNIFFMSCLPNVNSLWSRVYSKFCLFIIGLFVLLLQSFDNSIHTLEVRHFFKCVLQIFLSFYIS